MSIVPGKVYLQFQGNKLKTIPQKLSALVYPKQTSMNR